MQIMSDLFEYITIRIVIIAGFIMMCQTILKYNIK